MKLWYNSSKLPIVARTRMPGDKIVFDLSNNRNYNFNGIKLEKVADIRKS